MKYVCDVCGWEYDEELGYPEGGIDPQIIMMEVRQNDRPALMIANISNHTDTIGGDIVSADWPGRMEAEIQREFGYDIPVMTIIAPQGNINHFDHSIPGDQTSIDEALRIGEKYADCVMDLLKEHQLMRTESSSSSLHHKYHAM